MTRNIFLSMQMTLDGYIAGPSGQPEFAMAGFSPEHGEYVLDTLKACDTMFLGRVAWEEQSGHWPFHEEDPIGPVINAIDKVVFSTTLADVSAWSNSRIAQLPLADVVAQIRSTPGANIFVSGGQRMAQSMLREGVMDELLLYIHPVSVGSGLPLFLDQQALSLEDVKLFPKGVVLHRYRVNR